MNRILIDANLLCVIVVGASDPADIRRHPRLKAYDGNDYRNIIYIVDRCEHLVLCPHVLTETSNLLPYRQGEGTVRRLFATLSALIQLHPEQSTTATSAAADAAYNRLGFTDAVLLLLAADARNVLLSDDGALCREAVARGLATINYNYVRDGALRLDQIAM